MLINFKRTRSLIFIFFSRIDKLQHLFIHIFNPPVQDGIREIIVCLQQSQYSLMQTQRYPIGSIQSITFLSTLHPFRRWLLHDQCFCRSDSLFLPNTSIFHDHTVLITTPFFFFRDLCNNSEWTYTQFSYFTNNTSIGKHNINRIIFNRCTWCYIMEEQ